MTHTAKIENTQTATFTQTNHTGKIASNRRENSFQSQLTLIGLKAGKMDELAQARFYGSGSRVYCCVWINGNGHHVSGGGFAGGYGYHKTSAALESALVDAGVALSKNIHGGGDAAMEDALEAIGYALGYTVTKVIKAHA